MTPKDVARAVALAEGRLRLNPDLHDSLHTLIDRALLAEHARADELQGAAEHGAKMHCRGTMTPPDTLRLDWLETHGVEIGISTKPEGSRVARWYRGEGYGDTIRAAIDAAMEQMEAGDSTKLALLFSNDWLRERIAADPDDDPEAGPALGPAPAPIPLLVQLRERIDEYAELDGEDDCATEQAVYLAELVVQHSEAILAALAARPA